MSVKHTEQEYKEWAKWREWSLTNYRNQRLAREIANQLWLAIGEIGREKA